MSPLQSFEEGAPLTTELFGRVVRTVLGEGQGAYRDFLRTHGTETTFSAVVDLLRRSFPERRWVLTPSAKHTPTEPSYVVTLGGEVVCASTPEKALLWAFLRWREKAYSPRPSPETKALRDRAGSVERLSGDEEGRVFFHRLRAAQKKTERIRGDDRE